MIKPSELLAIERDAKIARVAKKSEELVRKIEESRVKMRPFINELKDKIDNEFPIMATEAAKAEKRSVTMTFPGFPANVLHSSEANSIFMELRKNNFLVTIVSEDVGHSNNKMQRREVIITWR